MAADERKDGRTMLEFAQAVARHGPFAAADPVGLPLLSFATGVVAGFNMHAVEQECA